MKKKNWDKAETDLTRALELHFIQPSVYQNRGACRMKQGNCAGAIADLTAALQFDPRNIALYVARSQALSASGDLKGAQADLDQALALDPKHVTIYLLRGWFHLIAGQAEQAAEDADAALKKAGRRHPQAPYVAILSHCARRRQHPDEARDAIAETMSKEPKKSWPESVLRYLHGDMSAEELLRAASDDDQRTEARAYIGAALWVSGAADKVREHLEWVRDRGNPDFIEYGMALMLLHRLEK